MRYYLDHPFAFGPWWLYAMLVALAVVTAAEFVYIGWWFRVVSPRNAQRAVRRGRLVAERRARALDDLYWGTLRPLEYAYAMLLTLERTIHERPDLVAEILDDELPALEAAVS